MIWRGPNIACDSKPAATIGLQSSILAQFLSLLQREKRGCEDKERYNSPGF
jgi:hypothetical protein